MYNTTLDDFSVVGSECPFKRDAFGETMTAFRKRNFGIGAYFSKPDWHRHDFWDPNQFATSRHANYHPGKKPEVWKSFKTFVQGQIQEITRLYKPDILWFDGDWIKPTYEDLGWHTIAKQNRDIKPDIILVNRNGRIYEDYVTPEQGGIPTIPYVKPWEICMTMGTQWAYKKNDNYKPTKQLINILLSVVANGGNFLLDIGPDSQGQFSAVAMDRLRELGDWMKVNAEGIHFSQPIAPFIFHIQLNNATADVPIFLTQKDEVVYAYVMTDVLPRTIQMPFISQNHLGDIPFKLSGVQLLGSDAKLKFEIGEYGATISIPDIQAPCKYAYGFKLHSE
jgi:alpha-L-fucosidase